MSGVRNRNVLIISYYFPPLGMGGVQRVAALTSHLTRLDWNVSVLTVKPFEYPAVDRALLECIPKSVRVYRAATPSAEKLKLMFSRSDARPGAELTSTGSEFARWAMLPDSKVISLPSLLTLLPDVIRKSHPAVVITTSPPPSIHLAGVYAKKQYGLRWVADFRDVWFPQSQIDFRTPLHRKLQNHLENTYVRNADAVVVVSDRHAETLKSRYRTCDDKVFHVSNGFNEADFESESSEAGKSFLSLGYCGTLNRLTYVNGLFELLNDLADDTPLTVDIMGVIAGSVKQDIERINQDVERIRMLGSRSHNDAVQFIRSRNANLITLTANAHLESTIPGKAYEILRAERPAIAVVPRNSAAWNLLSRFDNVLMVDASDVPVYKKQIAEFVRQSGPAMERRTGVQEFDWNNLVERYAEILKRVIG